MRSRYNSNLIRVFIYEDYLPSYIYEYTVWVFYIKRKGRAYSQKIHDKSAATERAKIVVKYFIHQLSDVLSNIEIKSDPNNRSISEDEI